MTEHAAVIFVFFFLAEYASIVLICTLISILFIGGYLADFSFLLYINFIDFIYYLVILDKSFLSDPILEGILHGLSLSIKTCIIIFVFIWVRACFPRVRFDQLMSFCWTILLPVVIAFIILVSCILYSFDIIPSNVALL